MGVPTDTDPAVARLIVDGYRRMTAERRLVLAAEMSVAVHDLLLAGLRHRHPGADEKELTCRAAEIYLGVRLAAAALAAASR